ncbi:MAG: VWA domain-containing protein [Deltaproteobacteria bacterium]|nr:VWA domain-containing protein [Deltaproteobacteria bacterium]
MPRRLVIARRAERGAMALVMLCVSLAIMALLVAGITLGDLVVHRQELQNAADALALTDAWRLLQHPWPPAGGGPEAKAAEIVAANASFALAAQNRALGEDGLALAWADRELGDDSTWVSGMFEALQLRFSRTARAAVHQLKCLPCPTPPCASTCKVTKLTPQLMLVLDYSRSMDLDFCPLPLTCAPPSAIATLRDTIRANFLDVHPPLSADLGLVQFCDTVFTSIDPAAGNAAAIKAAVNADTVGHCYTNAGAAIDAAAAALRRRDYHLPRVMIVVSDGAPETYPGAPAGSHPEDAHHYAVAAARTAMGPPTYVPGDDTYATIYTVEIRRTHTDATFSDFMTEIAGDNEHPGDDGYHYVVDTAAALKDQLKIKTEDVHCAAGPLTPLIGFDGEPADAASYMPADAPVFAYYRTLSGFDEEPLRRVRTSDEIAKKDGGSSPAGVFYYDALTGMVKLSDAACKPVVDGQQILVVRYGTPALLP